MGSGRTLKFALCEVLQFAGLSVPLFLIMQKFAAIIAKVKTSAQPPSDGSTAYWLIVASSIAYVTSTALLVWVPLKYMVFMKKKFLIGRKKWRPIALVYVILSTLPCFVFLIASSEVHVADYLFYHINLSLLSTGKCNFMFVFLCIILLDWTTVLKILPFPSPVNDMARDADIPSTVLTHVEQIAAVTPITPAVPGQASTAVHHIAPYAYMGPLRFLCASDAQVDMLVDSFMFWMDTVEMVRVAGHPLVFYSGWVFPIYIFCYLSCLRVVVMPQNPLLSSLGVALQDLPFFFVRVGLIAIFGFVTPILYLMKNLLVCLAFVYFNLMTKLKVFNTKRMLF
uniref:Uncharacterized protein n=1 Tax=Monopterus albus TaxID=43700 RepID=A0A3Q3R881_MONAL